MKFLHTAEGRRLFDEIERQPASREARQALARWLTGRGDPLGEFIEEQLQRPGGKRETALRFAHYEAWLGPLADLVDPFSVQFHHGFLQRLGLGYVDGSYSDLTPAWIRKLKRAVGAPQTRLLEVVVLGKGVGLGTAQTTDDEGSVAAVTRTTGTGRQIPLVAFLTSPAMSHLARVEGELAPNVEAALRALRPALTLATGDEAPAPRPAAEASKRRPRARSR